MSDKIYLYGARDTVTKKLVSDITNPRRKYWDRRANAQASIDSYNNHPQWHPKAKHNRVELVTFELVEVKDEMS